MRNWSEYNKKLVNRSRIDLYFSEEVLLNWYNKDKSCRYRPRKYSNIAIKSCILIKSLFRLTYRGTEGMLRGLIKASKIAGIEVPSYSQINRRQGDCEIESIHERIQDSKNKPLIVALDSTGMSIFTPGQWHERKHGAKKSKWLKLHAAVDVETGQVLDYQVTDSNYSDSKAAVRMLTSSDGLSRLNIKEMLGDGAYDDRELYELLHQLNIKPNVRIRKSAVSSDGSKPELKWRDEQIYAALKLKLKKPELDRKELFRQLRLSDGYGKRALSENLFSRLKAYFGDKLASRKLVNILTEIKAKIFLLNQAI